MLPFLLSLNSYFFIPLVLAYLILYAVRGGDEGCAPYAGMPERSNGTDSRSVGSVPTKVQILLPALALFQRVQLIVQKAQVRSPHTGKYVYKSKNLI